MKSGSDIPLVTVICTCYNHGPYVHEALLSVINQTYQAVQLIVVDNASKDESPIRINEFIEQYPTAQFIQNSDNLGICKAFNQAVKYAKGKYLIDLAADDILLPEKIKIQVEEFERLDDSYGMMYSNIEYLDQKGRVTGNSVGKKQYPSGRIFKNILKEYIIPSPSTIFKKDVFLILGGYNENLVFEDFDYWVRCSYRYNIQFQSNITVQKRVLKNSLSSKFLSKNSDDMLRSTLITYEWAYSKIESAEELKYFQEGMSYFFRQCVNLGHFSLASDYLKLMNNTSGWKNSVAIKLLKLNRFLKN